MIKEGDVNTDGAREGFWDTYSLSAATQGASKIRVAGRAWDSANRTTMPPALIARRCRAAQNLARSV